MNGFHETLRCFTAKIPARYARINAAELLLVDSARSTKISFGKEEPLYNLLAKPMQETLCN